MDKQTLKTKLKSQAKNLAWRAITTVILTLTAVVTVWVYASFVEPSVGPNSSDQDFAQNILGNNDANNDFTSSSVVANNDGSIVERLEYLSQGDGLVYKGQCDSGMGASATSIVSVQLAGFGDDYFNTKYWMKVIKNANSVGTAPEMEIRQITDYVSTTGTFTVTAFSTNVEASDEIIILHDSLPFTKYVEYTSGSGNWTVPAGVLEVDVLIVAGGGYGVNSNLGAGGGGGEIVWLKNFSVKNKTTISYVVGAAAALSSFANITAAPGGSGSGQTAGVGGTTAGSDSLIYRTPGGAGGAGGANVGVATIYANGGNNLTSRAGGGASYGPGANATVTPAPANSGGGGGAGSVAASGGTGYILILWR